MSIFGKVTRRVRNMHSAFFRMADLYDLELERLQEARRAGHPNPFCRHGRKVFSQADEDGLIAEAMRRMSVRTGTFVEFGCGNGTENNTLALLAQGWRGAWIGGETLVFDTALSQRLNFQQAWVTLENIGALYDRALAATGAAQPDVLSLDLDGNDLHFARALLAGGARPRLFVVEYNGKFAPPIHFSIAYDPDHAWADDDYQGASLASMDELFRAHGYFALCCNAATGVNAFFARQEDRHLFPDVPEDLDRIFVPPLYHFAWRYGHRLSPRTLERVLS